MKKQSSHNIATKCCRLASLMLIVIILGISFVQALHSHKSIIKTEQTDEGDSGSITEKCSLCEFYVHKHGKELHLSYPPVYTLPITDPVSFNSHCYIGNYKFTLQGFTNKGPPAFIA